MTPTTLADGTTTGRPDPAPAGQPPRRPRRSSRWLPGTVAVVGVLALFELATRTELLPSRYFPPMTAVLGRLGGQLADGSFWAALGQTLQGWAVGLAIAIAIAVPLGLAIGSTWWLYRALRPVIEFLRPVPSVALIPLAVLVYGSGLETKVFLVAFASMWPLLLQTVYGARDVDPVALATARSYRLRPLDTVTRVVLPSLAPYLVTGVRISSSVALVLAVTAELVVGTPGIGRSITAAQAGGDVELMYALIIVTGLLGWGLNAGLRRLERPLLHWHASQRSQEASS
jgi:ABC-type nitrate/sulfonate/bicarbonate transport system permease component